MIALVFVAWLGCGLRTPLPAGDRGVLAHGADEARARNHPPTHSTRVTFRKPRVNLRVGAPLWAATRRSIRRPRLATAALQSSFAVGIA
jgi:hypothetical protein